MPSVPGIETVATRVICLDRKRKERCDVNFPSIQAVFSNAQWFNAIDVVNVDTTDPKIVHPVAQIHIRDGTETDYTHVASRGAIGASLSHAALWKQCLDSGQPMVVVEDDMFFNAGIQNTLRNIYSKIPDNADFAALVYIPTSEIGWAKGKVVDADWRQMDIGFSGFQTYYITPVAARTLLQNALPMANHIDVYAAYVASLHREDMYWYTSRHNPYTLGAFLRDNWKSTIGHANLNLKKYMPNNNWFYIITALVLIICLVFAFRRRKYICRKYI